VYGWLYDYMLYDLVSRRPAMNIFAAFLLSVGLASFGAKPLLEQIYGAPTAASAGKLSRRAILFSIVLSPSWRHGWAVFTAFSLLFVVASLYGWWTPFLERHSVLYLTPVLAGIAASRWNEYAVSRAVAAGMGILLAGLWVQAVIGDVTHSVSSSASGAASAISSSASRISDPIWKVLFGKKSRSVEQ
jgi:hypothetical protein